jgi:hypothetical protein
MSHYSRGGGDPNIVQHGGHRRHAPVTATRDRMRGSDTMAKIPLTFACGLYDRMQSLFCLGKRRAFREKATRMPPELRRIYLPNAALMAFAAFLSSCLIKCA